MFKYSKSILLLTLGLLLSCGKQDGNQVGGEDIAQRQINVVATTGMIGDAVRKVGGERVSVVTLMGPGVDPHLYKASEGDVSRMSRADMIFYNGLHLEGKMAEIFAKMQQRIKTVAVTDRIERARLDSPPAFAGNYDPHVWFDVTLWMEAVRHIAESLAAFDPTHAGIYQNNAARYLSSLDSLNAYVRSEIEKIPADRRVLITAHDAFHYFGRAYGLEVHGLQGISTASETGTADVQELAEFIVERQIPAIFVETSVPPRYIEALRAAVKSRRFDVKIGGSLFSDAMGDPGTPQGVYLGMVRHNVDTIVGALGRK